LQLWVFQRNTRAIRFYEHNGFQKVKETDGALNEEKLPDAMFEWRRLL
jgi:RimJ/RimL family protein N-acetyltransferase